MNINRLLVNLGKLLLCGLAFSVGVIIGGMLASLLKLPAPQLPQGFDAGLSVGYLLLESPLLALVVALVGRGLTGGFVTRALILSFLTWIAYTVNTQLEAAIFTTMSGGFWFTLVAFLVPSLMCGAVVAWLFPPHEKGLGFPAAWKTFFSQRPGWDWAWRLAASAVVFMPIYYGFGLVVVPFTGEYYRQNMLGLRMPSLDQILVVLFARSVLFLVACLPAVIAWQRSRLSLFVRLGLALFVLVGLLYMLAAYWMPLSVRLPHSLEILADEFVYAGALTILLARRSAIAEQQPRPVRRPMAV